MQKNENLISALISIILGLMLIVMKGEIISITLTILGIVGIIMAIIDFVHSLTMTGIIKAVVGACVLVFGWMFVNLSLYILAAVIIIMGLMQIVSIHRIGQVFLTTGEKMLAYIRPVLTVIAGAILFFNQGGVINWVFVLTGILLLVEGVLNLVDATRKN